MPEIWMICRATEVSYGQTPEGKRPDNDCLTHCNCIARGSDRLCGPGPTAIRKAPAQRRLKAQQKFRPAVSQVTAQCRRTLHPGPSEIEATDARLCHCCRDCTWTDRCVGRAGAIRGLTTRRPQRACMWSRATWRGSASAFSRGALPAHSEHQVALAHFQSTVEDAELRVPPSSVAEFRPICQQLASPTRGPAALAGGRQHHFGIHPIVC